MSRLEKFILISLLLIGVVSIVRLSDEVREIDAKLNKIIEFENLNEVVAD